MRKRDRLLTSMRVIEGAGPPRETHFVLYASLNKRGWGRGGGVGWGEVPEVDEARSNLVIEKVLAGTM